ncbi:MAG: hypothetical protein CM1200mP26_07700 [Acidimicrobiales bacterium]|nr:MAG: hypothetical protein CM1200mP26_07700 [Acidimicrobiales bacterium]
MNLAYVPAAPTEAALVFDLAVSAANIFSGTWEAGAGAVAAENQALAWLASFGGMAGYGRWVFRFRRHGWESERTGSCPGAR